MLHEPLTVHFMTPGLSCDRGVYRSNTPLLNLIWQMGV